MKKSLKTNNTVSFIMAMSFGIGLIFFIAGICISTGESKIEKVETTGIIDRIESYRDSDGDVSHKVYVIYEVNGEEYYSKLSFYSSDYYEGKKIDVYYDKNNPEKIGVPDDIIIVYIFLGMGTLFMIIGCSPSIYKIFKNRRNKQLKRTGRMIYAAFEKITLNTFYSVNNRHPYQIICSWVNPEDNQKHLFKSQNLWIHPGKIIEENNIKSFPVYMDSKNPLRYYMEIESLEGNKELEQNGAIRYK